MTSTQIMIFFSIFCTCLSALSFLRLFTMSLHCFHSVADRQAQSVTQASSGILTCPCSLKPSCWHLFRHSGVVICHQLYGCGDLRALRGALNIPVFMFGDFLLCDQSGLEMQHRFKGHYIQNSCPNKSRVMPPWFTAIIFSHNNNSMWGWST